MNLTRLLIAFIAITLSSQAYALSDEALFQHARDSYASKNEIALIEDVAQLKTQQYILAPYADYWLMLLKMNEARDEEVQNFLATYADTPFADRVRGEWLKKLGKQENWVAFYEELNNFQRDDQVVQCYALYGHLQLGDADVAAKIKALWQTSEDLPTNCSQLFDAIQKTGVLTNEDIWMRFRLALQDGKLGLAKSVIQRLPNVQPETLKLLDRAYQVPQLILDKGTVSFKTRFGIEVNLYAIDRLARSNLEAAISTYGKVQNLFDIDTRGFAWGRIAYHAARAHHPQTLSYFALADIKMLDKDQLAWEVRAALRAQNWPIVLSAISAMPEKLQEESVWRYWKARALNASGHSNEAMSIFGKLSLERHYYGWLAAEELEGVMSSTSEDYNVTNDEVSAIASRPDIKRALELQRIDLRWDAKAEWAWATRNYDDKQLLAASEYAMRQKWYDIAISTAENTKQIHNFNLRYPTPYKELFHVFVNNVGLDEAWVYGITRQESRFMHYAKSGVGAVGLMQLMPATAKWAAKRIGLSDFTNSRILDLGTNIELGTYYMRYTLDLMGGQVVMATAGYNAGPRRAKLWAASQPLEAAIYIEGIPYSETRNYVQKVMANAQIYAPRLGLKIQTLKSRIGIIPGNGKQEGAIEDTPESE